MHTFHQWIIMASHLHSLLLSTSSFYDTNDSNSRSFDHRKRSSPSISYKNRTFHRDDRPALKVITNQPPHKKQRIFQQANNCINVDSDELKKR